jgi:ABC-2 type transport system ATP-binding protein
VTAIEARGLARRFGAAEAVAGLDLTIDRHRITGLLGRNGAGKSTTIKMLLGMISPTGGTCRVLGHDIADPRGSLEIRRRVACVGEDKGLYGYMTGSSTASRTAAASSRGCSTRTSRRRSSPRCRPRS